jgi:hypothetical protein
LLRELVAVVKLISCFIRYLHLLHPGRPKGYKPADCASNFKPSWILVTVLSKHHPSLLRCSLQTSSMQQRNLRSIFRCTIALHVIETFHPHILHNGSLDIPATRTATTSNPSKTLSHSQPPHLHSATSGYQSGLESDNQRPQNPQQTRRPNQHYYILKYMYVHEPPTCFLARHNPPHHDPRWRRLRRSSCISHNSHPRRIFRNTVPLKALLYLVTGLPNFWNNMSQNLGQKNQRRLETRSGF